VANGGSCTRFEFARAIVQGRVAIQPISASDAARPAQRPANSALASDRWLAAGFRPLPGWETALTKFLEGAVSRE
jgi:dTDP-4-dehydrorhamnose reductase